MKRNKAGQGVLPVGLPVMLLFVASLLTSSLVLSQDHEPAAGDMVEAASVEGAAGTELSAREWLAKMSDGLREVNYQGVFTYQRGDKVESLRIVHGVIDDKEYETLEYMDGDEREVVRNGHLLSCYHPGNHLVRLYDQQQAELQAAAPAVDQLQRHYQFVIVGNDRIAGRPVVHIAVSPRDKHRYGHQLFLDKETGLLLKSELSDSAGKPLERFQFVAIDVGVVLQLADFNKPAESKKTLTVAADHNHAPANSAAAGTEAWKVAWLPQGFISTAMEVAPGDADMRTFTDGMAVFSVFLEPLSGGDSSEGIAFQGATIAYSLTLQLHGLPHRVIVVGEIPQATAKEIARSVVLADS